jgi:hypothetical protein
MQIADTSTAREYLLRLLESPGDEIVTARSGKRLLRLTPLERVLRPRGGRPFRRKLWVADAFDLPDAEGDKPLKGDGV